MQRQGKSCCNDKNCTCPTNNCQCQNCNCPSSQQNPKIYSQEYSYNKNQYYSNISGKVEQQKEQSFKHSLNDSSQEQILREQTLQNGKVLVTKQVFQDGKLTKIDQFVKRPEQSNKLQFESKENKNPSLWI